MKKKMKLLYSLAMAMTLIFTFSAIGASAATTYTVTANLFVPGENNEVSGVDAYLTNPFVMPLTPVTNNATITANADGSYTLSVPVVNNTFALIALGTPALGSGVSNIVETRNTSTYGSNTGGRITNLTMKIVRGTTSVSFTGSHEYSSYFFSPGDKYFNLKLNVDWTNVP